jgi:hypothetical protein
MAAEFSRELSVKVAAGQLRMARLGFHMGGSAGLALRRQLVDPDRAAKAVLGRGERKALTADRVRLIRGPAREIRLVRRIHQMAVDGRSIASIVRSLNDERVKTESGRPWSRSMVANILTNEKYKGALVYNKRCQKLKMGSTLNDSTQWIRTAADFAPIIDPETFDAVQARLLGRKHRLDEDVALAQLKALLDRHGYLSTPLVERQTGMPKSTYWLGRYGSMRAAFAKVGFESQRNLAYIARRKDRAEFRRAVLAEMVEGFARVGVAASRSPQGIVTLEGGVRIATNIPTPAPNRRNGKIRWPLKMDAYGDDIDLIVVARVDEDNTTLVDYCFAIRRQLPLSMKLYLEPKSCDGIIRSGTLELLFDNAATWAIAGRRAGCPLRSGLCPPG